MIKPQCFRQQVELNACKECHHFKDCHAEKAACQHSNKTPAYTHVVCKDCYMIKADGDDSWGRAKNKWFNSLEDAKAAR